MYRLIGHVILVTILNKKSCLFGKSKLTRNAIKSKFIYNGRRITFDGADARISW